MSFKVGDVVKVKMAVRYGDVGTVYHISNISNRTIYLVDFTDDETITYYEDELELVDVSVDSTVINWLDSAFG